MTVLRAAALPTRASRRDAPVLRKPAVDRAAYLCGPASPPAGREAALRGRA